MAVAKDEAAYIHEFIHHYLYFGFSHIFIGVNRTSDNTTEVLEKIQAQHSNVYFYNIDWIDWARPNGTNINEEIQFLAYASFIAKITNEFPEVQYCALLDIDEFWYPTGFQGTVDNWLQSTPYFDTASFYWACQFGDEAMFSKPFINKNARPRGQIKSFINLKSQRPLDRVRAHSPLFKEHEQVVHIDACGNDFAPRQGLKAAGRPTGDQPAYILHRMTRSEVEYVSNLRKGMLEADTPIKTNRTGYWSTSDDHRLPLDPFLVKQYHDSLDRFTETCLIQEELRRARDNIMAEADTILNTDRTTLIHNSHHYCQSLHGTKNYHKFLSKLESFVPLTENECSTIQRCYEHLKNLDRVYAGDLLKIL